MTIDTRTEAERRYDAERSGQLYVKPEPSAQLLEDDQAIIDWVLAQPSPTPAIIVRADYVYNGNINQDGIGAVAYINYKHGNTEICFDVGVEGDGPFVFFPGSGGVSLDQFISLMEDMSILLADPRVQAAQAEAYTPCSSAWEAVLDIVAEPTNNGRDIPIVPSRDQAHRDERLLNILETIADMIEPAKSEAFGYARGVLDALLTKGAA